MMRPIVSAACGLWLCATDASHAQAVSGVVVELYTSQGCSSCPPADAVLADLADQPGVIALALHVDYWDYIGWQDTFGDARYTDRQKAYAHAAGERMIYTPQVIVGGVERIIGHEAAGVAQAIATAQAAPSPVALTVTRQGDQLIISLDADPPLTGGAMVQLVRYLPQADVAIENGENAGMQMDYRNVVTSWQRLGDWTGQEPLELSAEAKGDEPAVVIVQREGPAQILAAAVVK